MMPMQAGVWLSNRSVPVASTWKSLAHRPRGHTPRLCTSGPISLQLQQCRKDSTVPSSQHVEIAAGAPPGDDAHTATTSPTGASTSTPPRRQFAKLKISTLDPTKLTPGDYMDLSGRALAHATLSAHSYSSALSASTHLHPAGWPRWSTFPPGTRGFLYYRTPWGPPLAGELRFRLARTPDRAGFAAGADLVAPNGVPWSVPLYNMPHTWSYRSLEAQLLADGLVPQWAFDVLAATPGLASHASHASVVSAFGQEFRLQFSRKSLLGSSLLFVGADAVAKYVPRGTLGLGSRSLLYPPFQDSAIMCCFERSTLPEHVGKRVVVLRLKRYLDPSWARLPAITEGTRPREGELMTSLARNVPDIWAVDVDKTRLKIRRKLRSMLRVLFENEERYGAFPQETS
uniref:N/A n=1 Tax=Ganoderma boninense TaxID=34458 RepID=A0A5K1JVE5_9APHY|nr:N/A [Ganoderma boninense]